MKLKEKVLLLGILLLSVFFRFYDLNWDQNAHLHPDERFLTMVGNAMRIPASFANYMDPAKSTLNPANIGFNFYVYGTLPLVLNKIVAVGLGTDNYNDFTLQGRALSALADIGVLILVFLIVKLLEEKFELDPRTKYLAAFLYAIFVLPIQLSHFFAVDTFLNLFALASFYFALNYSFKKHLRFLVLSGASLGLAFASKISAVYIVPLVLFFILQRNLKISKKGFGKIIFSFFIFAVSAYVALRIADPYLFKSPDPFILSPNPTFVSNLKTLQSYSNKDSWIPPNIQWIHKTPIIFPLQNLIIFGVGIPAFIFFAIGLITSLRTRAKFLFLGLGLWMLAFFLYQGTQTATTMRYFIMLYPFIAIFAGLGLSSVYKSFNRIIFYLILFIVTIWTLFFFSIYTKPESRITASYWIYQNIPPNSVLLSEHWDDALPVSGLKPVTYQILEMPVFDPDVKAKWDKMNELLQKGDYIILSSNRGWGSIPTVPERYTKMTKFYRDLFEGKLAYKKVKEFTSYPSLSYLGIPLTIPDDSAEEAFTVYDHPKVMIFKKQ